MELLKKERSEMQAACERLIQTLHEIGYIDEWCRRELIMQVIAGDKTAYGKLKDLLIAVAVDIGKQ